MRILDDEHEAVVLRCLPLNAGMNSAEGIAFSTVGMLHKNGGGLLSLPTKPILHLQDPLRWLGTAHLWYLHTQVLLVRHSLALQLYCLRYNYIVYIETT